MDSVLECSANKTDESNGVSLQFLSSGPEKSNQDVVESIPVTEEPSLNVKGKVSRVTFVGSEVCGIQSGEGWTLGSYSRFRNHLAY